MGEENKSIVERLAEYPHTVVTVVDQDPDNPEGPVTGSLNRYSYSFERGCQVLLSEPLLRDLEDVVRRGRKRLIISRGQSYTAEEAHAVRLSGAMAVYPDSDALRQAAATVGEVRSIPPTVARPARKTRDLAAKAVAE